MAERFARDGYDLVLVARRADLLTAVAEGLAVKHGVTATPLAVDLELPDGPEVVMDAVERLPEPVDALVNSAGLGHYGSFAEMPLARARTLVRLNMEAIVALTSLVLPGMLARRRGRIANLSSTAAFQPGPRMAIYYATKAFVLSFSEALSHELAGTGVTVTAVCPGPTPTGFQRASGLERRGVPAPLSLPVDRVAGVAYRAMMRGKRLVIPGLVNRLLALGAHVAPRWATTAVVGWVNRERS
jgi:short-subunit dehydrogenase